MNLKELITASGLSRLSVDPLNRRIVVCADMSRTFADCDGCDGTGDERDARTALIVHAVNILPELVEAAEHLGCCDFPDEIEHRCPGCVKALETIRKATTINIEQKGK